MARTKQDKGHFEGEMYYSQNVPKGYGKLMDYDYESFDFLNKMYNDLDRSNENTIEAQNILRDIGYYDGPIDGHYNNETKGAIKRYLLNRNDEEVVMNLMKGFMDTQAEEMMNA